MRILFVFLVGLFLLDTPSARAQESKEKEKEPANIPPAEIGGRSIEQWIKDIHSKDRSKGETAIQTVLLFGPDRAAEALPVLIGELKRHTSFVTVDVSIRVNATMAIGAILSAAKDPDPEVVKDAILVLNRMLGDNQEIVKYRAAEALGRLGPAAKSSIPLLLAALRDPNTWKTRQAAATALGFVALDKNEPPLTVTEALLRALNDPASQVRIAVLQALPNLAHSANERKKAQILGAINGKAQTDPEASVRIWAHMGAMITVGKVTDEHVSAIAGMLRGNDVGGRIQAAQALARIGQPAKMAVPRLIAGLKDKRDEVATAYVMALPSVVPKAEAEDVILALQAVVKDTSRSPAVRQAAEMAIMFIHATPASKKKSKEKEND